ncbi:hypothetical protein BJX62DRAFT_69788 [Aspergillus germanicus]
MYGANSAIDMAFLALLFLSSRTLDLANDSSWITNSEMVGRNILSSVRIKLQGSTAARSSYLGYHTSSSNNCTISYRDPLEDSHIPCQPTVLANMDLLAGLRALRTIP